MSDYPPLTLPLPKKKLVLVLVISIIFSLIGLSMINNPDTAWIGWISLVVFGAICIPSFIFQMFRSPRLVVDQKGFEVFGGVKSWTMSWSDVETFEPVPHLSVVAVHPSESYQAHVTGRAVAKSLTGGIEISIILYGGKSAEELADLLNSYLAHYRPASSVPTSPGPETLLQ